MEDLRIDAVLSSPAFSRTRPYTAPAAPSSVDDGEGVNVRVCVRCRPLSEAEKRGKDGVSIVQSNAARKEVVLVNPGNDRKAIKTFTFDRVFDAKSTQEEVYADAVDPLVTEVLEGYNGTVFAYGQTGTGKTYTMEGSLEETQNAHNGVIPRACNSIFERLEASGHEYSVRVSFLELYNEELTDLLANSSNTLVDDEKKDKGLRLFEDATGKRGIMVSGLEEILCQNSKDVFKLLNLASARRRTAATAMNERSSRSHSIFTITIHTKESTAAGEDIIKIGKLNLVDLAGSENIARSGAKKVQAKEAGHINQSLLTLGRVITALVEHLNHIPYRDSKLTRLLQESLGGRAKTVIIATLSPHLSSYEETQSTLDYANRAKNIKNKPEINQKMTQRAYVKDLSLQMAMLKKENEALRLKNGIYLHPDQMAKIESDAEEQKNLIIELEAGIQAKEIELERVQELFQRKSAELVETVHQKQKVESKLSETETQLDKTVTELGNTKTSLSETKYLVGKHVETESTLYNQADTLKTTLQKTVSDVGQLFNKIDRKTIVEEHNRNTSLKFQDSVSNRIVELENQLGKFQGEQDKGFSSLHSSISEFMKTKSEDFSSLILQASNLLESVSSKTNSLSASFSDQTVVVDGQLDNLNSTVVASCKDMEESFKNFSSETSQKVEMLHDALILHRNTLLNWSESICKTIEEQKASSAQMYEEQYLKISQLTSTISERMENQKSSLMTKKNKMIDSQREFNTAGKKSMQDMMSMMQNMMNDFQNQQEQKLNTWITVASEDFDDTMTEVELSKVELLTLTEKIEEHQAIAKENSHTSMVRLSECIQQNGMNWENALENCSEEVKQMQHILIEPSVDKMIHNIQETKDTYLNMFSKNHSEIVSQISEQEKTVTEISTIANSFHQEQQQGLENLSFRTNELGSVWVGDLNHSQQLQANHMSSYSEILKDVSHTLNHYVSKELKMDIPTGQTPLKKDILFPTNLVKTEPHDQLLKNYRKSSSLEVVEEVQEENLLKISPELSLVVDDENSFKPAPLESSKAKPRAIKAPLAVVDLNLMSN